MHIINCKTVNNIEKNLIYCSLLVMIILLIEFRLNPLMFMLKLYCSNLHITVNYIISDNPNYRALTNFGLPQTKTT